MKLVSQAESIMQEEFVSCQACHLLLALKINLAWDSSWLGRVVAVLIADGAHSIWLEVQHQNGGVGSGDGSRS